MLQAAEAHESTILKGKDGRAPVELHAAKGGLLLPRHVAVCTCTVSSVCHTDCVACGRIEKKTLLHMA